MFMLTWAARHVALDSDLSLHVGLHQNSLQHKSSSHWVSRVLNSRLITVWNRHISISVSAADVTHVGADDDWHPLDHVHKYLALPSLEKHTHTYGNCEVCFGKSTVELGPDYSLEHVSYFQHTLISEKKQTHKLLLMLDWASLRNPDKNDPEVPDIHLSAGLNRSGGCRTRSNFTLLCLCSELQKNSNNNNRFGFKPNKF